MNPSERSALLFFSAVALLGAAVRVHRAGDRDAPSHAANEALQRQIAEVDSARTARVSRSSRSSRMSRLRKSREGDSDAPSTTSITSPLDLDTAPAESLERLPRI